MVRRSGWHAEALRESCRRYRAREILFDRPLVNSNFVGSFWTRPVETIRLAISHSVSRARSRDDEVHSDMVIPGNLRTCRPVKRCLIWQLELYAAFLRLAASRE